jgi:hypothetical protein
VLVSTEAVDSTDKELRYATELTDATDFVDCEYHTH